MITLFIFALISEIPFNLMMKGKIFFLGKQNVYFTLLLGCLLIYILRSKMKEIFKFFTVNNDILISYPSLSHNTSQDRTSQLVLYTCSY